MLGPLVWEETVNGGQLSESTWLKHKTDEQTSVGLKS